MLNLDTYKVKIELVEDLLGTVPKNKEVYASFIAARGRELLEKQARKNQQPMASGEEVTPEATEAALAEEIETVQDIEERGWTGFHADKDGAFLYDYAVKGFLCEAARTLKERGTVKQLQDKFKRYVFVQPRRVRLPEPTGVNERPLRAQTAQGPRVTLVRSDVVQAGGVLAFDVAVLAGGGITASILEDVLAYGAFLGLGQWRSGGHGRFSVLEMLKV